MDTLDYLAHMTSLGIKKEFLKNMIRDALIKEPEIQKIILFGSFLHSSTPNDIDVAIFQNSEQQYITLAMKYRKLVRNISKMIPVDILPIKSEAKGFFIEEINKGEIIYERWNQNLAAICSKYPVGSALPDFNPDEALCHDAILIASNVFMFAKQLLG